MSEDKREHLRLPLESKIFIELVSSGMGSQEAAEIATCKTMNVSRRGLQVSMEQEVTIGAILHIGVQMPDQTDPLYLAGEVEWCRGDDATGWCAGFRLLDANNSDIDDWVSLLTEMDS